ncbi:unnamed protein product [Rhizophagus irregularis]|uniref:Crinkler effector protein N-terminal domain-containing protein n=1 Tax=Rhizophagus irregularis TaxID=588596 RepID=A0A915Z968_9GLOM|nr:unnamed protein product [Rhizophagus irregularis]CAB5365744.1 unnamed protein product [Rhizophagus irregularis]
MTSVALNCLVCGEDPYDDIFSVQINTSKNISSLKRVINDELQSGVATMFLKLFKVDIKLGKTRDENVIAMLKLEDLSIAQGMNILEIVSDYFSTQPDPTSLHILVQIPTVATEPPKKRAKIEGDTDAEVAEDVKSLRNFWQALKTTKYDKEMPFFTVSEDIKFFGKRSRPSKLFVRKCYNDLLGIIIDNIKNGKRDYRLTGNPGIGKTFFGYYLIYDLVKKGKTVIYDVHTMERFVILLGQTVEEVKYLDRSHDSVEIRIYLSKPEVWYIVDGNPPDDSEAITILICSLNRSHYKTFDKRIPVVRYMPPWSWDEINTCRADIFANLKEKKVRELYTKWGGIPRYILEGALVKGTQSQLNLAIKTCDESIFRYIGGDVEDISHKLIHIWTNSDDNVNPLTNPLVKSSSSLTGPLIESSSSIQPPHSSLIESSSSGQPPTGLLLDHPSQSFTEIFNQHLSLDQPPEQFFDQPSTDPSLDQPIKEEYYTDTIVKFASDYVGQQVILELEKSIIDKCHVDVDAVMKGGKSDPVVGCLFEQIAHRVLRNGGSFKRRSLDTNDEDVITFPKYNLILFTQIDKIQDGAYSIPLDKSFPSVDAIIAPNCLLQMTTTKDHNIKINELKRVRSKLETEKNIGFYFVVPTKLYDIYKKQRYSTTDEKDALNTGPWIKQCLKQYVLGIDLNFRLPVEMSSASSITEQKCYCKGSCNTNQCGCQRNKLPCGEGCHPKNKNKYFPAILTLVDIIFSLVITVVINYTNTINKIFYPTNVGIFRI